MLYLKQTMRSYFKVLDISSITLDYHQKALCRSQSGSLTCWQVSHLYGFSPLCVLLCLSMWYFWMKRMLHWSQLNGFSPDIQKQHSSRLVVIKSTPWLMGWIKPLVIWRVVVCHSPLCIFSCRWRRYFWMKLMLHWLHLKGLSPEIKRDLYSYYFPSPDGHYPSVIQFTYFENNKKHLYNRIQPNAKITTLMFL